MLQSRSHHHKEEILLADWVRACCAVGHGLSPASVRAMMLLLVEQSGASQDMTHTWHTFCASHDWLKGFMRRWGLSIRKPTTERTVSLGDVAHVEPPAPWIPESRLWSPSRRRASERDLSDEGVAEAVKGYWDAIDNLIARHADDQETGSDMQVATASSRLE